MKTYVMITTAAGMTAAAAAGIEQTRDVVSVVAVTGPFDLIVLVETESFQQMGSVVLRAIQSVPGVERTLTCPVVRMDGEGRQVRAAS
jgi:DNA-binding Lrp family transcriptional regulator